MRVLERLDFGLPLSGLGSWSIGLRALGFGGLVFRVPSQGLEREG